MSGGGDSVALLALTAAWAARHGRRLVVLTVDHGLAAESGVWCAFVAELAARFGADTRVLRWTGPKPATGLPAAARAARHALLADAARVEGARVVLLGHTADDDAEGEVMRAEGVPLGRVREWGPSPAWPEGRGVFLLRPLLGCSREALRVWLAARDLPWIEDPANADPRYARVRAREALTSTFPLDGGRWPREAGSDGGVGGAAAACPAGADDAPRRSPPSGPPTAGHLPPSMGKGGDWFANDDGRLGMTRGLVTLDWLGKASSCASGRAAPLRGRALERLHARLAAPGPLTATLGGARVVADAQAVAIGRDAGETARGGLAPLAVTPGETAVWDGRFELHTDRPGLTIAALRGHAARLPVAEREALKALPAWARPALPVVLGPGLVTSPILASGPARARCLVADRLAAALGQVLREP